MHTYRECVRHIWNTQFLGNERPPDWDLRDQFCDAALILFQALVFRGLDVDDTELRPDYHGDQAPLMFLRLEVSAASTILVNRTGAGTYWDDPVTRIEAGDCARIVGSSRYPHLIGRDALLPVSSSVKVLYERAAQQAAAADEREPPR
jgi:hypothetical protein